MTDERDLTALIRDHWERVLGHADFTDDESFFRVGGHSFRGVRLMADLSDAVGARLPMRLLVEHPTIRELTAAVRDQLGSSQVVGPPN